MKKHKSPQVTITEYVDGLDKVVQGMPTTTESIIPPSLRGGSPAKPVLIKSRTWVEFNWNFPFVHIRHKSGKQQFIEVFGEPRK